MEKMMKTAKVLDTICNIAQILTIVAAVSALIGALIVGAFFVFDLRPEQVATGYNALELGDYTLLLTQSATPEPAKVLINGAVEMGLGAVIAVLAWFCVRCVREILTPMKAGLPFQKTAAEAMGKLALLTVIIGALDNGSRMLSLYLTAKCYGLPNLLVGGNVASAQLSYELDLTFLLVGAVLLLLSYVFGYGAALQQQADETL